MINKFRFYKLNIPFSKIKYKGEIAVSERDDNMINIAICDDDSWYGGQIENLLYRVSEAEGIKIQTEVYFDGVSLIREVQKGTYYDLIYMDIQMKEQNGIDTARIIRKNNKSVLLIYVSSHEEYLKDIFEVEPFRFLPKPLDESKFIQYFKEAYYRIAENNTYFQFTFNKEIFRITYKDIVYFESRNRVIHVYLADGTTEQFYGKLNNVEHEIAQGNQRFLRIHQSYLVNYNYVRNMNYSSVVLDAGEGRVYTLQISEERQKKIRSQLCMMTIGKAGKE